MKHTAQYIVLRAQQGDEEFLIKLGELQRDIIEEREKYLVLRDEQVS